MKTVADTLSVARSNMAVQAAPTTVRLCRGRRPQPDAALVAEIKELIADLPTYGYRRVHALLRRSREQTGAPSVNVKRVYRLMKVHGLLLQRHSSTGIERRHDGRVAVDQSDTRWCSDGFEIGCDNGEGSDIRDLMVESVERRFGLANELPKLIEWLSDNGSPYTAAETRALARLIGLVPRITPIQSPQSNGMAEAFVKTIKRDYARVRPCPDAATVIDQLNSWFEHYNSVHPHKSLRYRSPREFRVVAKNGATEYAVGAPRRPHHSALSTDGVGSSPSARGARRREASGLTRARPWTTRKN